ncbi:large ribosomal subunit protein mL49 [Guaruba guarouba]
MAALGRRLLRGSGGRGGAGGCRPPPSSALLHPPLPVPQPPGVRAAGERERRLTELQHVEGDLWALEREVRELLQALGVQQPEVQVNEVTGRLRLKGHWGAELRRWLLQKGF